MQIFTLLLASAPVVGFGAAACVVDHTSYVDLVGRSLDMCLAASWLSDLAAA